MKRRKQIYPEPTVGALIFYKEKALLVKGNQSDSLYVIPGGHIEIGESIEEALHREIIEETGLQLKRIKLFGIQDCIDTLSTKKKRHYIFIDFICDAKDNHVCLNDEHKEYLWVAKNKLLEQPLNKYTRRFIAEYLKSNKSKYLRKIIYNYYQ
jgi:nucleoside triphosphatase